MCSDGIDEHDSYQNAGDMEWDKPHFLDLSTFVQPTGPFTEVSGAYGLKEYLKAWFNSPLMFWAL